MREGCKELWPQPHLRLVCWTLKSCRDRVEAEQFIRVRARDQGESCCSSNP